MLADEYMNRNEHDQAIVLYESCLSGFNEGDPDTLKKLLFAYYQTDQFQKVIAIGDKLKLSKTFQFSDAKLAYAWSFYHTSDSEKADAIFKELNVRFANHQHRLEYADFLLDVSKKEEAISLLDTLLDEVAHMDSAEKRLKRHVIRDIKNLRRTL